MKRTILLILGVFMVAVLVSCASSRVEDPSSIELMQSAELNYEVKNPQWKSYYYVDDFGSPTDKTYIWNESPGVFSNSATSNSYASLGILAEQDRIAFEISEYNLGFPVSVSSYENVVIRIQTLDEEVIELRNTRITNNGKRIVCDDKQYFSNTYRFYSALLSSSVVKISIKISSTYSSSSYLFAVSSRGLAEAYHTAFLSE